MRWKYYLDRGETIFTQDVSLWGLYTVPWLFTIVAGIFLCCCCTLCYKCCRRSPSSRKLPGYSAGGCDEGPLTSSELELNHNSINLDDRKTAPPAPRQKLLQRIGRRVTKAVGRGADPWIEKMDEHNKRYFWNQDTGETSWTRPDGRDASGSPWTKQHDDNGREYFFNTETHESRWTDPSLDSKAENADLPTGWHTMEGPGSKKYYYNALTGKSQWNKPEYDAVADEDPSDPKGLVSSKGLQEEFL